MVRSWPDWAYNRWSGLWDPTCTYVSSALGITYFYYPKSLYLSHTYFDEDDEYQEVSIIRAQQCAEAPFVKRNIPYCHECMLQYVNFGERGDGLVVPFGRSGGAAYNI